MVLFLIISVLSGVSVVVARIINARLAEKIGIFPGTLINYVTGLFFSFLLMLFTSELFHFNEIEFAVLPLWAYLGGLTGVVVIVLSSYVTPRISSFYLTLFIFIAQLFVGILFDYMLESNVSPGKIAGGLFVLTGLTYNLMLDRKSSITKP